MGGLIAPLCQVKVAIGVLLQLGFYVGCAPPLLLLLFLILPSLLAVLVGEKNMKSGRGREAGCFDGKEAALWA